MFKPQNFVMTAIGKQYSYCINDFSLTPLLSPPLLTHTENVSAPLNLVPCEECEDNNPHTDKVTQRGRSCFSGLPKRKALVSPTVISGVNHETG